MPALRDIAAAWLQHGQSAIVVEVSEARGSVPREAGTRMLVSSAACAGTIGGGHLEWKAIAKARAMLGVDSAAKHTEHYPLGPALGQCCGGAVTLEYSRLDIAALARWHAHEPWFALQLYGAGHVGRAIVQALATLPVRIDWFDEREAEFEAAQLRTPRDSNARIRIVCIDAIDAEVRHAPAGAFYLVLTHQHDLDLRITQAILRRGDFAYLGLIGSKTKKQRFVHRLVEQGIDAAAIERLICPIGVPGIVGKEPEVIALAVVAQLLQCHGARSAASPGDAVKRPAAPESR